MCASYQRGNRSGESGLRDDPKRKSSRDHAPAVDVNHVANHRFLKEFAAAFLMPSESVRKLVESRGIAPTAWTFEDLLALKSRFGVSAESFALRLEELGLIDNALRLKFRDQLQEHYRKNPDAMEPAQNPRPHTLGRRVTTYTTRDPKEIAKVMKEL